MSVITIGDREFAKLSDYISSNYGIKMPEVKKTMLQARLQKRLKSNNLGSFKEYCDLVFSEDEQSEVMHMIDVVSTNKTEFFRESAHFDFMSSTILPEFEKQSNRSMKVWSAACSSGEEVYTLAMVLSEYLESRRSFDFSILGTDISMGMLEHSSKAVYGMNRIENLAYDLKKKYLLKNKKKENKDVRIVPELRRKAQFKRLNLISDRYDVPRGFDVIFCRNVLIYFERNIQEMVIKNLLKHLKKGGYFFLGHSESITGLSLPLKQIKPTIYQKT